MGRRVKTVQQYIDFLDSKGFTLHDDAIGLSNLDNNTQKHQMN